MPSVNRSKNQSANSKKEQVEPRAEISDSKFDMLMGVSQIV